MYYIINVRDTKNMLFVTRVFQWLFKRLNDRKVENTQ